MVTLAPGRTGRLLFSNGKLVLGGNNCCCCKCCWLFCGDEYPEGAATGCGDGNYFASVGDLCFRLVGYTAHITPPGKPVECGECEWEFDFLNGWQKTKDCDDATCECEEPSQGGVAGETATTACGEVSECGVWFELDIAVEDQANEVECNVKGRMILRVGEADMVGEGEKEIDPACVCHCHWLIEIDQCSDPDFNNGESYPGWFIGGDGCRNASCVDGPCADCNGFDEGDITIIDPDGSVKCCCPAIGGGGDEGEI